MSRDDPAVQKGLDAVNDIGAQAGMLRKYGEQHVQPMMEKFLGDVMT